LQNWLSEFRIYRRDEKGKIVKQNDHLMDATRYGLVQRDPNTRDTEVKEKVLEMSDSNLRRFIKILPEHDQTCHPLVSKMMVARERKAIASPSTSIRTFLLNGGRSPIIRK
jgi:hypothetical protein